MSISKLNELVNDVRKPYPTKSHIIDRAKTDKVIVGMRKDLDEVPVLDPSYYELENKLRVTLATPTHAVGNLCSLWVNYLTNKNYKMMTFLYSWANHGGKLDFRDLEQYYHDYSGNLGQNEIDYEFCFNLLINGDTGGLGVKLVTEYGGHNDFYYLSKLLSKNGWNDLRGIYYLERKESGSTNFFVGASVKEAVSYFIASSASFLNN